MAIQFAFTKKIITCGLFGALLALPAMAHAAKVYLNGVDLDGVTSQTFNNCNVTIDARGDVFISAKGYQIQTIGADTPLAAPSATAAPVTQPATTAAAPAPTSAIAPTGPVTMRYWLVTEKAARGMTQYDIDIYINNKFIRRLTSKEEQVVMDVTEFMRTGNNAVYVVAKKNTGSDGRLSTSPQHYFKVIIGESSTKEGKEVYIDKEVLSYTRNAAESQDFTDLYNINAR